MSLDTLPDFSPSVLLEAEAEAEAEAEDRSRMKTKLSFLLNLAAIFTLSKATATSQLLPEPAKSFNISFIQQVGGCTYSVAISTSCSSPTYTRDRISLAFGDAYGNQIYVPRLDNPSTKIFESCSTDTFHINGPCAYQICYVYLYRSGPDGWIPETVKISGYNARTVTFDYNTAIPSNIWYGFNFCGRSSSNRLSSHIWFMYVIAVSSLMVLL